MRSFPGTGLESGVQVCFILKSRGDREVWATNNHDSSDDFASSSVNVMCVMGNACHHVHNASNICISTD
jgi:hypothetical protein